MIDDSIRKYHRLNKRINKLTKLKNELRDELINDLVPETPLSQLKQIVIPKSVIIGNNSKNIEEYVEDKFPEYQVYSARYDQLGEVSNVKLIKKPQYRDGKFIYDNIEVTKTLIHNTPDVDWDSLEEEHPKLAEDISEWEIVRNLNEDRLETAIEANPELLPVIERNLIPKKPSMRITTKEIDGS